MQDDEILKMLKSETPYLADEGFTDQVLSALPPPNKFRRRVIGFSWTLALTIGLVLWVSGGPGVTLYSSNPAILLSAATLGFWALLGLFFFVAADEGMLEI